MKEECGCDYVNGVICKMHMARIEASEKEMQESAEDDYKNRLKAHRVSVFLLIWWQTILAGSLYLVLGWRGLLIAVASAGVSLATVQLVRRMR